MKFDQGAIPGPDSLNMKLQFAIAATISCMLALVHEHTVAGVLVETNSYSTGEFRGIRIGASKDQVLETLHHLGVYGVKPIPKTAFEITRANRNDLHLIKAAEGIRVFNYRGVAINVLFLGDAVISVDPSVPARDLSWIKVGESRSEVAAHLDSLLASQEGLEVIPIVDGAFVRLAAVNSLDVEKLKEHDRWRFELTDDKPAGATVELTFHEGHLLTLDYKRARFPK